MSVFVSSTNTFPNKFKLTPKTNLKFIFNSFLLLLKKLATTITFTNSTH